MALNQNKRAALVSLINQLNTFSKGRNMFEINKLTCSRWLEPSNNLYELINKLFNFLFGANFSEPIAKFIGLFALLIYIIGLLQWFIIKLPKSGRNSGFSNYGEY